MDCAFCESGKLKKKRNLEVWEMIGQLLYISDTLGMQISHVVLMGIGEPFDNFDNVMNLVDIITNQSGLAIASRHVTISTAGIVPRIIDYADRTMAGSLAISLHAPNDELRNTLMPINKAYPLCDLIAAARLYSEKTRKKVTFAYIMIKDINDTDECADKLISICKKMMCHVNLIPVNHVEETGYTHANNDHMERFKNRLTAKNVNATLRRTLGEDISAACGQLKRKVKSGQEN
jgi:23S rRNA (adenine2503-C2)-methyltransferase